MPEIITDVIDAQNPIAEKAGVRFVFDWQADLVMPLDRRRIFQVVNNLTANAIRFSPEGGCIAIAMTTDADGVTVSVQDEGPGIPAVYHEAIFQKYFRTPEGKRRGNLCQGSQGIGLAICKGLVEAHGGRIWVESASAEGSCFYFYLPMDSQRETAPQRNTP